MSKHHLPHIPKGAGNGPKLLKIASESSGAKAALAGAVGVAGTVATGAAIAGFALTPIGLGVMLAVGATAGSTGGIKKGAELLKSLKDKL
jgi:hypothetical protein